ncbi:MAG: MlaD family protein [Pseudomonadota bacterium]
MSASDTTPGPARMTSKKRRNPFAGISYIWLVPILAMFVALFIAWQAISARGPIIEIEFTSGDGMQAGSTELRFRDVRVGVVEKIRIADDMSNIITEVRVDKDVAPFIDDKAVFWIVKPEVTARGVSGLQTVLSGTYIEGVWDDTKGKPEALFKGLEQRPLIETGEEGLLITLRAPRGGQLGNGAPIIYRGVRVGHMSEPQLTPSGDSVEAKAFIQAPYDRLVTTGTRFWNASGFSVNLGAGGVSLDVQSLATLVEGGVSFSTVSSLAEPVKAGADFYVFENETAARDSIFAEIEADDLELTLYFDGSISGLDVGAPVELEGLRVGSVLNFGAFIDQIDGQPEVRLQVDISVQPRRLEMRRGATKEEALEFLAEAVQGGLRARLGNQGILNPSLKIELVHLDNARPATLDKDHKPYPLFPTVEANLSDLNATAEGLLDRVQNLPFDTLMESAIAVLRGAQDFLQSNQLQEAPGAFVDLMNDTRDVVQSDSFQNVFTDIADAADEVESLVAALNQKEAIDSLLDALEKLGSIAQSVQDAVAGVPQIVSGIQELTDKANSLPVQELVTQSTNLVETTDKLLAQPDTQKVPGALTEALDQLASVLEEIRSGGLVKNANDTMAAASEAAASVANAAASLPELSAQLNTLVSQAEALVNSYGTRSQFSTQTLGALYDLRQAAQSVTSLARTLERDPSALIRGR